jgi:flagellar hook-basal body complex protein FliE
MPRELARAGALLDKSPLGNLPGSLSGLSAQSPDGLDAFAKLIAGKVQQVNAAESTAQQLVHQLHRGQNVDPAEVLTAVQQADLAMSTMLQVRDHLLQAYRELQQIQI